MAESLGGDQGVRVDEDGHGADQGEDDQEGGGDHRDCPLHKIAVGGGRRYEGDGSEESVDKGKESIDPSISTKKFDLPFHFNFLRTGRARQKAIRAKRARSAML